MLLPLACVCEVLSQNTPQIYLWHVQIVTLRVKSTIFVRVPLNANLRRVQRAELQQLVSFYLTDIH